MSVSSALSSAVTPEPAPLTLADWRRAYAAGASPRLLLHALAERLAAESPAAAWIHRASPQALAQRLDALEALGPTARTLPLYGVPFAVKDNIDVAGMPTTAACPAHAHVAEHDATVVRRLLDAGAVCIGKTNLDQFATGLVGTRSPYGRPASTFDAGRVSGGSSAGSAVVVARGDVPFALGTDTAGSGRVPAGFNNIVGLKPTPGRVGTAGVLPACRSLDCVSVFALTAADAAEVLALVEGDDPRDDYSRFRPGLAALPALPAVPRVGVPVPEALAAALDADLLAAWPQALGALRALGPHVAALDFAPLHAVGALLYDGPWVGERYAAVQTLLDAQPAAFDPTVRQVISAAQRHSAADAFRGQYRLRALARQLEPLWHQVDLLMVPTAPAHPTFAEVDADPIGANARLGHYTNFVNLLGWSALALPAGFTARGLPFGVTFIGPSGADAALARFGVAWQAALGLPLGATGTAFDAAPPLRWPAGEPALDIAVVGAHLSGMPLNHQLVERGAVLRRAAHTAPHYRLHVLPATQPPKPGLVRVAAGGAPIDVEVWSMPTRHVGSFLAGIAAPLGLGSVELADGSTVHGFVCEAHAVVGAEDITAHGGWRAWISSKGTA